MARSADPAAPSAQSRSTSAAACSPSASTPECRVAAARSASSSTRSDGAAAAAQPARGTVPRGAPARGRGGRGCRWRAAPPPSLARPPAPARPPAARWTPPPPIRTTPRMPPRRTPAALPQGVVDRSGWAGAWCEAMAEGGGVPVSGGSRPARSPRAEGAGEHGTPHCGVKSAEVNPSATEYRISTPSKASPTRSLCARVGAIPPGALFLVHRGWGCTPRIAGCRGEFTTRNTVSRTSAVAGRTSFPGDVGNGRRMEARQGAM